MYKNKSSDHPVVLFDGVCNLCNRTVQFIIRNDQEHQFRFASLQSAFGQRLMQQSGMHNKEITSFILYENERLYFKSTGALRVLKGLGGLWPVLYGFMIVPSFIRDTVYNITAKSRYQFFGKKESCWIPDDQLRGLFLDE